MSVNLVPLLASANVIDVFQHCDPVGQVITCCLAVGSIVAWAVMFGKRSELNTLRSLNHQFERHLRDQKNLLDLPESLKERRDIPYADLFSDAIEAYWRAAAIGKEKGMDTSHFRLEHAENALQRALARQTLRYESNMIFLASVVSGAPFLGLLGTVWGVMDAFSRRIGPADGQHPDARPRRLGGPSDHDLGPPGRHPEPLRLQHALRLDEEAHHGARELRELARRPHRARVQVNREG